MRICQGLARTLGPLVLAALFAGCGGKTILQTGVGEEHGQTIPGDSGSAPEGRGADSGRAPPGPVTIDEGGVTPTDDATVTIPPSDVCPEPSTIEAGEACASVGLSCTGSYDYCSPPNDTTHCTCESTGWACESHSCPEGPPTTACEVGGACTEDEGGGECILGGAGPCDSDAVLLCVDGVWEVSYFRCDVTAPSCGWATEGPGGGCSESCTCEEGGLMVCTGDCPDGGLASP